MGQAGAENRGMGEAGVEFIFGKVENLIQIKVGTVGMKNKLLVGTGRRILLIWAGKQTFAAAEEVISDFGGEVSRNIGVGLDSQIAYTFSGVEGAIGL